ncbi:isochorismatase family protein [Micromonospora sp. WMMD882]|uniref:isochorismatase family protein n=1 Tax=Micromonospora sp. WMMD882 TaxID=3015151 RepID=UPI00248C709F|nr:isochorismatase family protein [Micromonospora sp. WMMD882]WBB81906.1 isochorismatase family protein [Micromonospora sp. WMMD882]
MSIPAIAPYRMPRPEELPANTAGWAPDPGRAVLLVHDMQRYFLRPFPARQEPGSSLVANAAALLARCRSLDVPVFYTAQPGSMSAEQRGLLGAFWGPGMSTSPEHRQVVDELRPDDRSVLLTKWRYSAFQRTDLLPRLRAAGRDQMIICGVYAHVGCLMTAVEAFSHDIETFLVADAVADFSAEHHRLALDYAATRCSVVLPTATALAHLGEPNLAALA